MRVAVDRGSFEEVLAGRRLILSHLEFLIAAKRQDAIRPVPVT